MNSGFWETETRAYNASGTNCFDYLVRTEWRHITDNHYGFTFDVYTLQNGQRLPFDRDLHDILAREMDKRLDELKQRTPLHRRTIYTDLHSFAVILLNG